MFDLFFVNGLQPDALLWPQHNPWLVALSLLVSMGASAVALHLAGLAREMAHRRTRRMALLSGALALGCGIWTMHYIGMLAFAVCGQARFDPWVTLLSVLPALGASWVALHLLARERVRPGALAGSGLLVGAGIGAMHYIGMAASELAPLMRYDAGGFALSIAVAVLLAILALWVRFGLQQHWRAPQGWVTALAGCVMGLAIAGMHYTGMAALRFVEPIAQLQRITYTVPVQTSLSLAIAVVAAALGLVVVAANANLRYRQTLWQTQRSESRLRAITDTAIDGIITINGRGIVQSFNGAAERLLGWRAEEVIGRNVSMLMPEPHQSAHDGYLSTHLATGRSSIIGRGREVEALRKDGSVLPIRLAVGRVALPGEALFVGFITDISARRAMESALRRREEQLRTLVGNIPGVAFRCRNEEHWPMEFISDAVLPLTGWSADDFLQGRVHFSALFDPGDAKHIALDVDFALRQSQPYHVEYRITTREGQRRWISEYGRGAADEQGAVRWIDGVILDITTTKEHTAQFVGTVQALNRSEAVAEFDLHGNLLDANTNFLALMGYSFEEAIGQQHALFCPPPAAAQHDAFWQRLAQGEFQSGEFQRLGKGGREVWVHATYNPIRDADDKVCKVILLATDLSQRRALEQDLRTAKERAEAAAAARASFLANMSHEIRTPMNAIIGFTEALLDSPLDTTQRRQLGTVQHAARSLLHLLNDILDTAKLDKGAVVLEVLDFSLRQLCQQMLDTLRISAARKGLPLVLDYPESEPDHLRGDALRLQQVLLNLLGNAIKFTESGQVLLRVRYQAGTLHVDVEDTGIGMSAAQLERIFDPFAQADASTARRFGGTGLGTTIAHQLVQLMHGEISVRSQPGEGSVFSVRLPLPLGQPTPAHAQPTEIVLPPLRILAVDDVPANLELLQIALAQGGHRVVLAGNGQEALDCCARQRFDLVLMDLQMPGIDGLEATRRIRQREQAQGLPRLPVIALSASVLEEDQGLALAAGMDGFAHKPLDRQRLFAEIARVLGLDASAPVQQPGSATARTGDAPIDWMHGCRQWGSEAALREALGRFVQGHPDLPAQLQALRASSGTSALEAQAHRLRGATANLALGPLQAQLGRVEAAARAADAAAIDQSSWTSASAGRIEMQRRQFLASAPLLGLGGCAPAPRAIEGGFTGIALERGHALRDRLARAAPPVPALVRRARVVIAGGGIAGLAAARALRLAGQDDFVLLELEDQPGGNSRAGQVNGLPCPLGAHYLPLPGDDAHEVQDLLEELGLRQRVAGRWRYDERHLCHSPQERLHFGGQWQEGLLPVDGVPARTLAQYRRFAARVAALSRSAPFHMPTPRGWKRNQPLAPVHQALDALIFDKWLDQEGLDDVHLRWYLDYCCRDDFGAGLARVSAWAGIHYFASRHGFHAPGDDATPEREGVLTWPEGNGWLAQRLTAPLQAAGQLRTGASVLRIAESRHGVEVDVYLHASDSVERWQAARCVVALPVYVAARVVQPAPALLTQAAQRLRWAPWLVANLHIDAPLQDRPGAAPAWDNVLYADPNPGGLGYVDAGHQRLDPRATVTDPTVLTYYQALGDWPDGRQALYTQPWTFWRDAILAALARAHPDITARATRMDITRYGHAMSIPVPGTQAFLSQIGLQRFPSKRWQLSNGEHVQPLPTPGTTRLAFAHADWSGYSVFEEAFTRGHAAGLVSA